MWVGKNTYQINDSWKQIGAGKGKLVPKRSKVRDLNINEREGANWKEDEEGVVVCAAGYVHPLSDKFKYRKAEKKKKSERTTPDRRQGEKKEKEKSAQSRAKPPNSQGPLKLCHKQPEETRQRTNRSTAKGQDGLATKGGVAAKRKLKWKSWSGGGKGCT